MVALRPSSTSETKILAQVAVQSDTWFTRCHLKNFNMARYQNRISLAILNICISTVILLSAHPASFAHKFLFQRVPESPGMQ